MKPSVTAAAVESDLHSETAHILLIDAVGYSRLLMNEQIELMDEMNRIVRATPQFKISEVEHKLLRLPTGDGMALLFFDSPEAPVRCAIEIHEALRDHPHIQLRMGVHTGPINQVKDVNDQANVAGTGINLAQRVMDCGDAGHILVSKRVAEDLTAYSHWQPYLHEIGRVAVKHGVELELVNLYGDSVGNPLLPQKVRAQRKQERSRLWFAYSMIAAAVIALSLSYYFARGRMQRLMPEKSIAVLPFANLSADQQSTYFADGIQDQILSNLSRIADLKVISRTSVVQYRNEASRNLRDIAKALGVAHVLEGSVQPAGNRIRISAQLIDARTDSHIWAEHYDRDMADIFAIQSEVAKKVAAELQAKLLPSEKAAIEEKPTNNLAAYDLYLRAQALIPATTFNSRGKEDLIRAADLLEQAIGKDPSFFLAYYQLSRAHNLIYKLGVDHSASRLALAEQTIKNLQRLRPDAGETHLALGEHLYWGFRDYDRARPEVLRATQLLPNDPRPILLTAYMDRRQGRWNEALDGMQRALVLDPQSLNILQQISLLYQWQRRYDEMATTLDRALRVAPEDIPTHIQRAAVEQDARANTGPLRQAVERVLKENPDAASTIANAWFNLALNERNPSETERALKALPQDGCSTEGIPCPRDFCEGLAAQQRQDTAAAANAFRRARAETEAILREQPDYAEAVSVLGMIDAKLGRKEEAIREGRRAVELLPIDRDAIDGEIVAENLVSIYVWTGEKDLALQQLSKLIENPGPISYGWLTLSPDYDALRGEERFAQIVAKLAP